MNLWRPIADMRADAKARGPATSYMARDIEALLLIESLAREMIEEARLTPDGLIVREKPDQSDAHYRLCTLLWPKESRLPRQTEASHDPT